MTKQELENQSINLEIAQACENICLDLRGTYDDEKTGRDLAEELPNTFTIELPNGRMIMIEVKERVTVGA